MKTVILDGNSIFSKTDLHRTLAQDFSFPEWYGSNLDALFDCLTDYPEEVTIEIQASAAFNENLGGYAQAFRKVLQAVTEENPRVHFAEE